MKKISIFVFFIFNLLSFSQEQKTDSIIDGWQKSGKTSFLINQTAFSNWVSGGENSIAGTLSVDYNLNYAKNGWSWDTKMIGSFGVNKNSDSRFFKKIDDRIEINSVVAKKFIEKFSFSSFLNFKTQFAKGFKYSNNEDGYEIRTELTRIFSPAYIQLGVGMYWKESNSLWVNLLVTGRLILASKKFTNDLNEGEEYFGITQGQNSRFELGASVSAFYKFELVENIILEQSVNLYLIICIKQIILMWIIHCLMFMRINDYLSTTLVIQCLYDDNAIKRVQLREVFGLAFIMDITEIPKII